MPACIQSLRFRKQCTLKKTRSRRRLAALLFQRFGCSLKRLPAKWLHFYRRNGKACWCKCWLVFFPKENATEQRKENRNQNEKKHWRSFPGHKTQKKMWNKKYKRYIKKAGKCEITGWKTWNKCLLKTNKWVCILLHENTEFFKFTNRKLYF